MNSINNQEIYRQLDCGTKEIVDNIKSIKNRILSKNKIPSLREELELHQDAENEWHSYVVIINSNSDETLRLNIEFINTCISRDQTKILCQNNVIFRFESGDKNVH